MRSTLEHAEGSIGELERRHERVFHLDLVKLGTGSGVDARDWTPEVQEHVDRMDRLVDERAAVQRERPRQREPP
jgi:hypothetical protein